MFEFVLIQPGTFMMGSPEDEVGRFADETLYEVTISKPFYMQTTPVTQKQWKAVMGNNPSYFKGDDLPVECVSWNDCQEFIQRLNQSGDGIYRLPTEAEWEYACRVGTGTPFAIGNGCDLDITQANFEGNYPYGKSVKGHFSLIQIIFYLFHFLYSSIFTTFLNNQSKLFILWKISSRIPIQIFRSLLRLSLHTTVVRSF